MAPGRRKVPGEYQFLMRFTMVLFGCTQNAPVKTRIFRALCCLVGLFVIGIPGASLGADSKLTIVYWGGLGSIYYPATGADDLVVAGMEQELKYARDMDPSALLVDVGGWVNPACGMETAYDLRPLRLFDSIRVDAVHVGGGDWLNLVPGGHIENLPALEHVSLLSSIRLAEGTKPDGVETAVVKKNRSIPIVIAGVSRVLRADLHHGMPERLAAGQDSVAEAIETIKALRADHPDALCIVIADQDGGEAVRRIAESGMAHLILDATPTEEPQPKRVAQTTWLLPRFPTGTLAWATLTLGPGPRIEKITLAQSNLVPVHKASSGFWAKLGLASRKVTHRYLAPKPPLPRIGLNLVDPAGIVKDMGYSDVSCERVRCAAIPEADKQRIANKQMVGFDVRADGKRIGRLYRIEQQLPAPNGELHANVIFGADGRLVRGSMKIDPYLSSRVVHFSKILQSWEGRKPDEMTVTPELGQGQEDHVGLFLENLRLAARLDRHCQ